MSDLDVIKQSFIKLQIPFDKKFFNLPFIHYETLVEEIGYSAVMRHVRNVLMHYKDDGILSEKARTLIRLINTSPLCESKYDELSEDDECECGCLLMEEYENCPVCGKLLYTGDDCYYLGEDCCSIDGEECQWKNKNECEKCD